MTAAGHTPRGGSCLFWLSLVTLFCVACVAGGAQSCRPVAASGRADRMPSITQRSQSGVSVELDVSDFKTGMTCPLPGCGRIRGTWSGLRTHLNSDHHPRVLPNAEWLEVSGSKACPSCGQGVVALTTSRCAHCPAAKVKVIPKVAHLPPLSVRSDVAQVSLQTGSSKAPLDWSGSGGSCEVKVASVYDRQ